MSDNTKVRVVAKRAFECVVANATANRVLILEGTHGWIHAANSVVTQTPRSEGGPVYRNLVIAVTWDVVFLVRNSEREAGAIFLNYLAHAVPVEHLRCDEVF